MQNTEPRAGGGWGVLNNEEALYREFIEGTEHLVTQVDPQGRFTFVNGTAEQVFGLPPAACPGRSAFDFVHPEDRAATEAVFDAWLRERQRRATFENRQVNARTGAVSHIRWSVRLHYDAAGELLFVNSIAQDVTVRTQAEAQLARQREELEAVVAARTEALREANLLLARQARQLESLAENAPVMMARFDRDLRCLFVNRRTTEVTGIARARFLGQTPRAIGLAFGSSESFESVLRQVFREGAPSEADFDYAAPAGLRHLHARIVPETSTDGREIETALVTVIDITEQRKATEALVQSERLAAVGTLASGIAHQFNNINQLVIGSLSLALAKGQLSDRLRQQLEQAYRAVQRSGGLTHNLLAFTRPDQMKKSSATLAELATDTLRIVRQQFESEGIEIEFEPGDSPLLRLDVGQIEHVILNLLMNAHDAMLQAPLRRLRLSVGRRGAEAFLRIADTGCGIPPEKHAAIFEPFYTTKGEASGRDGLAIRFFGGSGLGLSVAAHIAAQHAGRIAVESSPGQGTAFTLWLPIEEVTFPAPEIPAAPEETLRGRQVLVVEDEAEIGDIVREILSAAGAQVVICRRAEEALDRCRAGRFDLVVSDLQMPGMGGFAFIAALAKNESRPPVLVMTGKISDTEETRLAVCGVRHILRKPFELDDLLDACRRTLECPVRPESPDPMNANGADARPGE